MIPIPTNTESVIDPRTGHMRPSWRQFLDRLRTQFAAAQGEIAGLQEPKTWDRSGVIQFPEDTEYPIWINASHGGAITAVTARCATGACTVTIKINGTPLGGNPNSVSTSESIEEHSSANEFGPGDDITLEVSNNDNCEMLAVTIKYTRALA